MPLLWSSGVKREVCKERAKQQTAKDTNHFIKRNRWIGKSCTGNFPERQTMEKRTSSDAFLLKCLEISKGKRNRKPFVFTKTGHEKSRIQDPAEDLNSDLLSKPF